MVPLVIHRLPPRGRSAARINGTQPAGNRFHRQLPLGKLCDVTRGGYGLTCPKYHVRRIPIRSLECHNVNCT